VTALEPLSLMPDVERLVIDALIADPDLTALVAGRVYGAVPNNKVFPLIRVVRFGGQMIDGGRPFWADAPALQIDMWANRKAEAVGLGETVRAVAGQRLRGTHPTGIVAEVGIGTAVYEPDESFSPAKPRVRLSLDLVTRPLPDPARHLARRGRPAPDRTGRDVPDQKVGPRA
jgi:hypothetical protein